MVKSCAGIVGIFHIETSEVEKGIWARISKHDITFLGGGGRHTIIDRAPILELVTIAKCILECGKAY
jgi:hypothetical protein